MRSGISCAEIFLNCGGNGRKEGDQKFEVKMLMKEMYLRMGSRKVGNMVFAMQCIRGKSRATRTRCTGRVTFRYRRGTRSVGVVDVGCWSVGYYRREVVGQVP